MESNQMENSQQLTRFGRHTVAALVSATFVKAMALVLVKILTTVLPKHDYGVYSLWMSFVVLVSTYSTSAFSATIWRFMPQRRSSGERQSASSLFATAIVGSLSILFATIVMLSILDAGGLRIVEDSLYPMTLVVVGLLTAAYALRELILVVSGSEQNSREILIFNLAFSLSSTLAACLVGWVFMDSHLVLVGLAIGYAIPLIISLAVKIRQYVSSFPRASDLRKSLSFGSPSIMVGSVKALVPFLTSLLVGLWLGLQEVATLSIAVLLAGVFTFVVGPPQTAYLAYIVNAYETGNYEGGKKTATLVIEMFLFLSTPVAFLMVRLSTLLIWLVSSDLYIDAASLMPFTVASAVLLSFSYFWKVQLDLVEKPHLTGITYLVSGILLAVVSLLLVPPFGLFGVGTAMVVQAGFVTLVLCILGHSQLPIQQRRSFWVAWTFSSVALIATFEALRFIGIPDILSALASSVAYLVIANVTGVVSIHRVRSIIRLVISRWDPAKD